MEQIKILIEKIETDKGFAEEIQPLLENNNVAAIIAAAEKKDIKITEAEWQKYSKWLESISEKNSTKEELGEEELAEVAGGGGKLFDPDNPIISRQCWASMPGGSEYRDGMWRKYCKQFVCKAFSDGPEGARWYQCKCWGTDKCKSAWHYDAGC